MRGFAPYVGGALGVRSAARRRATRAGTSFGTKFMLAPNAGVRWYPAAPLPARRLPPGAVEAHYPISYKQPASDGSRVLPRLRRSPMTSHPWATIGVGWTF